MVKRISILLVIITSFTSCEEENPAIVDLHYPTVITRLNSQTVDYLREKFYKNNKYIVSSLNQFGFCAYNGGRNSLDELPPEVNLTESEVADIVKDFISRNSTFTGIINTEEVSFTSISQKNDYWHIKSKNQIIDTIEVLKTEINFTVLNGEVLHCLGNWFPEVNIPEKFNYTPSHAKALLWNKEVIHHWWSGNVKVKVQANNLKESKIRLVVLPLRTDHIIALHVAWEIDVPAPVHYKFYVDVMTGDIIMEFPTIIS